MVSDTEGEPRWDGVDYSPHATHHRSFDDWFLERHPPGPGDVIVDAGCGTGEFSRRLAELVPEGRVIGVEPDPSMLDVARSHSRSNLEFRQGRVQELSEICDLASADLVVSRAVFHWIPLSEYRRCYDAVFAVLRPSGWFHAESGASGNVARLTEVLDDIAAAQGLGPAAVSFPYPGTAMELLEQAGFHLPHGGVRAEAQRRRFDRDQLLGFVRTQASLAYLSGATDSDRQEFLAAADEHLDRLVRHDGSHDQTFVRLDVLAQRPHNSRI